MAADMMGLALKAMGVDVGSIFAQAEEMGKLFERMALAIERIDARGERIEADIATIKAALGLPVPLPEGDMLQLIVGESRRYTDVGKQDRLRLNALKPNLVLDLGAA
jgi:hypothetical protein